MPPYTDSQSLNNPFNFAEPVGIVAVNQADYVKALFANLSAGNVVVPLRNAHDRDRISAANINRVITPKGTESWITQPFGPNPQNAIALISFTSGTEGAPKGVMLTHHNLANVVTRLNQVMQVDGSIREYVGVPVYHSFGFGRCRAVATAGGQSFIPSNGFNPLEIGEMLKQGTINAISAVPSLWRVLLDNQEAIGHYGQRVRWIEIGSQSMSRTEKEAMKALFPKARIVQHYGLTEASRTTLLKIHETEGEALESVGKAIAGVDVKLTETGQIAIRGAHVAQSYLIDGQQTPLRDAEGWFVTNDLGYLDNGYLYYQGRADDVINCGGIKVHPEALETKIYAAIAHTSGLAVCRKPDPVRGEGFLVAITPDIQVDEQQLRQAVVQSTQALGVNAANAIAIMEVEDLPKTATGKIQRKQLADWYASQATETLRPVSFNLDELTLMQAVFCRALNLAHVRPQDTFITLGGDSLSYVTFSMALERHLGYLPQGWEQLSCCELDSLTPQQRQYGAIESTILFRALAISGVVVNHAQAIPPQYIGGGATLLLIVAGLNFARFQGDAVLRGRFVQPIASLLRNLLIPYFVMTLIYQLHRREVDLTVLLLVSNFVSPYATSIFPVWFIQVLAQCMMLFIVPFGVRSLRRYAQSFPWNFGLIGFTVWVGIALLIPQVWNTDHLFNRMPYLCMWVFSLGWCVQFAQSKWQKSITAIAFLLVAYVLLPSPSPSERIWMLGTLVILALPQIAVPQFLKLPIQTISAAAYYIYLTHMVFIHLAAKTLSIQSPFVVTAIALAGGTLTWMTIQKIQQVISSQSWRKLLSRKLITKNNE
jgi:acyl-CoA synthetase (AMP-forming)/AMP-acid ligase II/membrane-bound acyltransferase YfiQ involved in biofilm formation